MIAFIAILVVVFGTISMLSVGRFLDRTNKYLFSLKLVSALSAIAVLSGIFTITKGTLWGGIVFPILLGLFITPILTICFSLATECTHPVQPALVTGMLMSAA
jgi:hypothetical protein